MVGTCKPWLKQHHRQGCMYMWISSRRCLLLLLFPCMSPINMRYFCFTILDATGGAAVHYWKENGTPTPQKYFLDMELCDTAVLVAINLLTRGIGVVVVVVGAVGLTPGISEKRYIIKEKKINFDHSWLIWAKMICVRNSIRGSRQVHLRPQNPEEMVKGKGK